MRKIRIFFALLPMIPFASCASGVNKVRKTAKRDEIFTPERILPSGADSTISLNPYTGESAPARKGIMAATLNNIVLLNNELNKPDGFLDSEKLFHLREAVKSLLPSLRAVGVFNLFSVEEWIADASQPGRLIVGVWYLQKYPQELSKCAQAALQSMLKQPVKKILAEAIVEIEGIEKT